MTVDEIVDGLNVILDDIEDLDNDMIRRIHIEDDKCLKKENYVELNKIEKIRGQLAHIHREIVALVDKIKTLN